MLSDARIRAIETARDLWAGTRVSRCLRRPDALVVATVPKTGSTSVEHALRAAGLSAIKIHFPLREVAPDKAKWNAVGEPLPLHRFVESHLDRRRRAGSMPRMKVITMVRDPVAQAISGAFQLAKRDGLFKSVAPEQIGTFARQRIEERAIRNEQAAWFAEELAPWTGIDVLARPFDRDRGMARISEAGFDLFVARMESLDAIVPALSDFVSADLRLQRRNVRSEADQADLYRRTIASVSLTPAELDAIYDTPWARHFYTDAEIAGFRDRWGGQNSSN